MAQVGLALGWCGVGSLTFAFNRLKSAVAPVLFFFRKKLDFGMAFRFSLLLCLAPACCGLPRLGPISAGRGCRANMWFAPLCHPMCLCGYPPDRL